MLLVRLMLFTSLVFFYFIYEILHRQLIVNTATPIEWGVNFLYATLECQPHPWAALGRLSGLACYQNSLKSFALKTASAFKQPQHRHFSCVYLFCICLKRRFRFCFGFRVAPAQAGHVWQAVVSVAGLKRVVRRRLISSPHVRGLLRLWALKLTSCRHKPRDLFWFSLSLWIDNQHISLIWAPKM